MDDYHFCEGTAKYNLSINKDNEYEKWGFRI